MTVEQRVSAFFGVSAVGAPVEIRRTRGALPLLFAELGYGRGAEIGVWEGSYSEVICTQLPGVELTCVDPWQSYSEYREKKNDPARLDEAYRTTVDRLTPYNCQIWRLTSVAAASRVADQSLDFVYIDGNHARAFVEEDLAAWAPKVRSGGILSGHDYVSSVRSPWIDVQAAVDAFVQFHGIAPWYVLTGDKSPSWFWVVS